MNERAPWIFGMMMVVMAALVARGVLPSDQGNDAGKPAAEAEKKNEKKEEAEDKTWTDFCPAPCLYQEFFGIQPSDSTEGWPTAAADIAASAGKHKYELEFLIALVPDPVDSHLSNRFDEALDALQRGIAASGYLFDRVSLPWEGEAAKKRLYRWIPGGMLFRKVDDANDRRRLLAVLLVGESPKGGIQKQAFFNALDFIKGLETEMALKRDLRILGPSFSGSAESLKIALGEWLSRNGKEKGQLRVDMVTGSASVEGLDQKFPEGVEFTRMVLEDEVLQRRAFEFLHEQLGWDLDDMAMITEIDTAYGRQWFDEKKTPWSWSVQFPSHLAHIRTAREKLGLDRDKSASRTPSFTRKRLDLSLADQGKPVDIVPPMSELTTQSNDLALEGLLRSISRERIRYVGIRATDIQDLLFLAGQVRSFCPDAVLFTFDNHLLVAHPEAAKSMDGTLVLTSFPLYTSSAGQAMRQYTSEFQQGIYLAARALVERRKAALQPSDVWVAAVGNGELWPVAVRPAKEGGTVQRSNIPGNLKAGLRWLGSALVIGLLAFWLWNLALPLQAAGAGRWGSVALPAFGAGLLWMASGVLLVFYIRSMRKLSDDWQGGFLNPLFLAAVWLGMTWLLARLVQPSRPILLWIGAAVGLVLLNGAMSKLWFFRDGRAFFYRRAGDFSSGLSPLVPLAFLGIALFAWAVFDLKRQRLIIAHKLDWPLQSTHEPILADCGKSADKLTPVLEEISPRPMFWGAVAIALLLPAFRLIRGMQPIAETKAYGFLFLAIVTFVFVLCAHSFYRFFAAWKLLERILDRLCSTWLAPTFSRISKILDWKPLKSFGLRLPPLWMPLASAQQLRAVSRLGLLDPDDELDNELTSVFQAEKLKDEVAARRALRDRFEDVAAQLAEARWESGNAEPEPLDQEGKAVPRQQEIDMREIETYLAIQAAAYLRYVFAHLRYALLSAMICGFALLMAVSSYAFQPKRFLSFNIWLVLLVGSILTLRAFVQMDRNGTLSAISGTDAGKVTLDRTFFSNLFAYGGIPVLGIVLTQFPAIGHLFGGWLDPLLRVIGGGG